MRTLTIALIAAFAFLLSQQLTAADDDRHDRKDRGASQAVISGTINCVTFPDVHFVGVNTFGGLGILATPNPTDDFRSFGFAIQHAQECSDARSRRATNCVWSLSAPAALIGSSRR